MLVKRGKIWHYEFVHQGKRYRGSCGTGDKIEATKVALAKRDGVLAGRGLTEKTVEDLANLWFKGEGSALADSKNNASRVVKLITALGSKVFHELTPTDIGNLKGKRIAAGNSPATFNRELALLQTLARFAKTIGVRVPDIEWREYRSTERNAKIRYLSPQEENDLLRVLASPHANEEITRKRAQVYTLAVLLLDTGARYSEVANLLWSDVQMEVGVIDLYRSKVGNQSVLWLTERAKAALAAQWGRRLPGNPYVFPAREGFTGPRGYAAKGIARAMVEAGINTPDKVLRWGKATPHSLRHTFATRLVQAGVDLYAVQKLLGHSTPTMTQRYAHLNAEGASKAAAQVLNSMRTPVANNVINLKR